MFKFGQKLNVGLTRSLCSVSAGRRLPVSVCGAQSGCGTLTANQKPVIGQLSQSEASIELERADSGSRLEPAQQREGGLCLETAQSIICDTGDLDKRTSGIRNTAWPPVR